MERAIHGHVTHFSEKLSRKKPWTLTSICGFCWYFFFLVVQLCIFRPILVVWIFSRFGHWIVHAYIQYEKMNIQPRETFNIGFTNWKKRFWLFLRTLSMNSIPNFILFFFILLPVGWPIVNNSKQYGSECGGW